VVAEVGTLPPASVRAAFLAGAVRHALTPLVYLSVAIVVLAVARFHRPGVHVGIERRTVLLVRDQVVVVVGVTDIAHGVLVEVRLVGVEVLWTVVVLIRHAVAIALAAVPAAVRTAVAVGVWEPFVGHPVAVVVEAVAVLDFGRLSHALQHAVDACAHAWATAEFIDDRAWLAHDILVHVPIAIVIHPIARLGCRYLPLTF